MDHLTVTSSTAASAAGQTRAGRFATHAELFSTFQDLVLDMQAKILDPAKNHLAQSKSVAQIQRPSDTRPDGYREHAAARDAGRDELDDRNRGDDRTRQVADDKSVQRSDDAGRNAKDDRHDDKAVAQTDNRDDTAQTDRSASDDRGQDVAQRDGDNNRGDQKATDGKDQGQQVADAANANTGNQPDNQPKADDGLAAAVQASIAAGQVDAITAAIAAQTLATDKGKEVSNVATNTGDLIKDVVQNTQQPQENLRGGNHDLARAGDQLRQLRAIANIQTNGQANGDGAKQAESLLQQQTAELAKTVGDDNKLIVNTKVTDEAALSALRSSTAIAAATAAVNAQQAGGDRPTQQNAALQNAQVQNPVALAAVAQSHQGQVQGQAAQAPGLAQASQAQAAAQLTADAKGPVQASTGTGNTGVQTQSGGAETNTTQTTSNTSQSQHTQQTQQSQQSQAQQHAARAAHKQVVDQVSVHINKAIKAGADRINIRLNPAELGKVEVKLEMSHDGRTVATITAEKPETLDMLRRDADALGKALQDAGLDMEAGDLNYNLKGEESGNDQKALAQGGLPEEAVEDDTLDDDGVMETAVAAHDMGLLHNGRVDVRA